MTPSVYGDGSRCVEVRDVDITTLAVDAITNAANSRMLHGGGVAAAIARVGGRRVVEESAGLAPVDVGDAIVTSAGDLPCGYVIHAVTMAEPGGTTTADTILRCTIATLQAADDMRCRSLAMVAFGTGVGGFPVESAARIQIAEVHRHLLGRHLADGTRLERVVFCVRGDEAADAFEAEIAVALNGSLVVVDAGPIGANSEPEPPDGQAFSGVSQVRNPSGPYPELSSLSTTSRDTADDPADSEPDACDIARHGLQEFLPVARPDESQLGAWPAPDGSLA